MRLFLRQLWRGAKEHYQFVLIISCTVILGFFVKMLPESIQIPAVAALLLSVIILVFMSEYVKFIDRIDRYRLLDFIANDTIITNLQKKIIFDDDSCNLTDYRDVDGNLLKYHTAKCVNVRTLKNNMKVMYSSFKPLISSSIHAPDIKEIKILVNKKELKLSKEKSNFEHEVSRTIRPNGKTTTNFCSRFDIPIDLKPKDYYEFEFSYKTPAYHKAVIGELDCFTLEISQYTEKFTIDIDLIGEMKKQYKLLTSDIHDICTGRLLDFEITDISGQRMINAEKELIDSKLVPRFNPKRAYWVVEKPKVGYKYTLYFKFEQLTPPDSSTALNNNNETGCPIHCSVNEI
jgi:hypothetical protein